MQESARSFMFAAIAATLLQACSGDDQSPGSNASDSGAASRDVTEGGGGGGDGTFGGSADVDAGGGGDGAFGGSADVDAAGDGDATLVASDADAAQIPMDDGQVDTSVGCGTPQYTHVSTFSSIFDGWGVANNSSPTLIPMTTDGTTSGTLLDLDPNMGSPAPGSAKLTIPFAGVGEQLLFALNSTTPLNLTGTTVSAQIRLDSGLNTSPVNPGRAYLVLKSTLGYVYAAGMPVFLDPAAGWVALTFDADAPTATTFGYTACDIREIDIIIETGTMGTYTTAVVHIDTIAITAPGADAGSGDGGTRSQGDASSDVAAEAADAAGGAG